MALFDDQAQEKEKQMLSVFDKTFCIEPVGWPADYRNFAEREAEKLALSILQMNESRVKHLHRMPAIMRRLANEARQRVILRIAKLPPVVVRKGVKAPRPPLPEKSVIVLKAYKERVK